MKDVDADGKVKTFKKHLLKTNDNKMEAFDNIRKEQRKAKAKPGGKANVAEDVKKPSKIEFLTKTCDLVEIPFVSSLVMGPFEISKDDKLENIKMKIMKSI